MRLKSELLGDRNARLLLGVTFIAGFGNTAMSLTASVWVLSLTGSASLAALCGLGVYGPSVAGPVLGTLVDRVPRRALLIWTCAVMAGLLVTLVAVRSSSWVWLIFVVMIAYGASLVLIDAGESAMVQSAVDSDRRGGLNSARMSIQEGMKLIAPLAGAALFTWTGGPSVALLAAACLLGAALLYTRVHCGQPTPVGSEPGLWRQTWEGIRFLLHEAQIRPVVLLAAVAMAATGLTTGASLLVIVGDLHRAPPFAGVLGTAQGAGSIVGGLVGGTVLRRLGEYRLTVLGATLSAVGILGLCIPVTAVVLSARVVVGIGLPWTIVAAFTAVQHYTSEALIGRVAASAGTLVFAPVALTISAGAGLITILDHRAVLAIAAGSILLACLLTRPALAPHPADIRDLPA
jgi:MFS family permease